MKSAPDVFAILADSPYMLLTTFRKDGTAVPTPVWVVADGDQLLVWTAPEAGKVKRIRRDGAVQVAPCTRGGRPLGDSVPATARVLAESQGPRMLKLLVDKYGLVARMTQLPNTFGRLIGRPPRAAGVLSIKID